MSGVYTIPSGYPFLKSLASGLIQKAKKDPLYLSRMVIFLPTKRACNELKRMFMTAGDGQYFLLPKFLPLGELDDGGELLSSFPDETNLKPLIPPFTRLGLLTKLIEDYTAASGMTSSPTLCLKLAKSLIRLLDQAAIEDISWENLSHLVPSELAHHWQLTLDFLEIIISYWPKILEEKGYIEPYARHHQLVNTMIARWETHPPSHPILAAGSTGTMPATARLLQTITTLPEGEVILPGLDTALRDDAINDISPCHPQYALCSFLKKVDLLPSEIPVWCVETKLKEESLNRARLFAEAMKPKFSIPSCNQNAQNTEVSSFTYESSFTEVTQEVSTLSIFNSLKEQRELECLSSDDLKKAMEGVYFVPCHSPQEEALVIAILLRQQLEIPHQRAVLITSDIKLAERVKGELKRWGIDIGSSLGEALSQTSPGIFLRLSSEFAASPQDQSTLLALLKHPLFLLQKSHKKLDAEVQEFEKTILRDKSSKEYQWLKQIHSEMKNFIKIKKAPFGNLLKEHLKIVEFFSRDGEGICQIWEGTEGKRLKTFMEELNKASSDYPVLSLREYASLLKELLQEVNTFPSSPKHPRLDILGPLEARLVYADVMILGGLNEGSWPPEVSIDPWLNRPMRQDMGFSELERRIGLSAHDFGQAFASSRVYLTRSLKVEGAPMLACRWLERIETYLKAWDVSLPLEKNIMEWARQLDKPKSLKPQHPPAPRPPVKSRPRQLSVTQIEMLMRDPYALYARKVLSLFPLNPLNVQMRAVDRGVLIHQALDQFFKVCPDPHYEKALDILLFIGKTLCEPFRADPAFRLFWWPRFCNLSHWFISYERQTRLPGTQTFTEVKGKLTFTTPQGPFECTAKADRIDLLPDGRLRILDYKTGVPPSDQDVQLGFSPQLPLEGAIALNKGFEGISATQIESLQFWWLRGDVKGGVVKILPGDPHELSQRAFFGLKHLIQLFENEDVPYPARPVPSKSLKYNDYSHLARAQEWGKL